MASFRSLLPLIILFFIVAGGAYIGYQIYLWSIAMTDRGVKHMEKKNMSFTKEGGLKVGVKEVKAEDYEDRTQNVLVNVWNNAAESKKPAAGGRPSDSRHSSTQSRPGDSRTTSAVSASGNSAGLAAPAASRNGGRGSSPVPGSW